MRCNLARVVMKVTQLAAAVLVSACVPMRYAVEFPSGVNEISLSDRFSEEQSVLVIPCWWRSGDNDIWEFGPPTVVETVELDRLDSVIEGRSGWWVHDPFGHEFAAVPDACGALLIGELGSMARVSFFGSWVDPQYGSLGPNWKAALLEILGKTERKHLSFEADSFRDIFGRPPGRILGSQSSIRSAREFVQALSEEGGDSWQGHE